VAPRFAVAVAWTERLEQNGGVEIEDARVLPRDDWKPVEESTLGGLVDELVGHDAVLPPTHLGLVQLPDRLRRAWWTEAERSGGVDKDGAGFERLFSELVEFLRFKRLPLPERVVLEVAVSAPGLSSTRTGTDGTPLGLGFGDRAAAGAFPARQPVGLVNLGDEESFVVLLPLPPATLAARLETAGERGTRGLSPHDLVHHYFARFPKQPCLRLRLAPGEGLWLPPFGVVHDGWTCGKSDVDVTLRVANDASVAGVP
jgi:hypothetical protein